MVVGLLSLSSPQCVCIFIVPSVIPGAVAFALVFSEALSGRRMWADCYSDFNNAYIFLFLELTYEKLFTIR